MPFYVDERTIVPRSFIGELLFHGLVGEGALIEEPEQIGAVLDLCTGGGSLAILAARVFPRPTSTRSICPPTRWRSRAATSRSMASPSA